ncbi:AMP-binding enzyme [Striga asiatica]|uniref:AMP-binding enzyme n=1 Tax=Striga asiatica TaxID=4170 RepID=A0A5A7QRD3_STRAF|nr:AMP-binding enzyme [Striga asiatica]
MRLTILSSGCFLGSRVDTPAPYLKVSLSRVSRLKLLAGFETQGIVDETNSTSRLMWLASLYNFTYLTEGTRPRKTCSIGVQFYFPSVLAALNLEIGKSASHYLTTREARKPYIPSKETGSRTRIEALRAAAGPRGTKEKESINRNWA